MHDGLGQTKPLPDLTGAAAWRQFKLMFSALHNGWWKAPAGARCQECQGPLWVKMINGRDEEQVCSHCGFSQVFRVS